MTGAEACSWGVGKEGVRARVGKCSARQGRVREAGRGGGLPAVQRQEASSGHQQQAGPSVRPCASGASNDSMEACSARTLHAPCTAESPARSGSTGTCRQTRRIPKPLDPNPLFSSRRSKQSGRERASALCRQQPGRTQAGSCGRDTHGRKKSGYVFFVCPSSAARRARRPLQQRA